jgi:hypothetical protein
VRSPHPPVKSARPPNDDAADSAMTDFIIDLAKTIGSISGIFVAAFLIWDRYVKHVPVAIVVARPLIVGSQQIAPFLLIRNASDRPVLIYWDNGDWTKLRVAKDQTIRGIVESLVDGQSVVSLGPEGEAYLPVLKPSAYDDIHPDNAMALQLRWRFAQPRIWVADRRLCISVRKRDFEEMIDGFIDSSKGRED